MSLEQWLNSPSSIPEISIVTRGKDGAAESTLTIEQPMTLEVETRRRDRWTGEILTGNTYDRDYDIDERLIITTEWKEQRG